MKIYWTLLSLILLVCACEGATFDVRIPPNGDGVHGKERWGYGYGWEFIPYNASANPNEALHWYDSPNGQNHWTHFQIPLMEIPAEDLVSAILWLNISEISGSGTAASLLHASNSGAATGNASDLILGDQNAGTIDVATGLGWTSLDVTDFIRHDTQTGYAWAAFSMSSPGYTTLKFASAEDAVDGPYLRVTVIPEPACLALGLLAGMAWLRRGVPAHPTKANDEGIG